MRLAEEVKRAVVANPNQCRELFEWIQCLEGEIRRKVMMTGETD